MGAGQFGHLWFIEVVLCFLFIFEEIVFGSMIVLLDFCCFLLFLLFFFSLPCDCVIVLLFFLCNGQKN